MMKSKRHSTILEIIEQQEIGTQEELAKALKNRHMDVTQATVSRDIKELRLVKVMSAGGGYHYATVDKAENGLTDRLLRMLADTLLSVAVSGNILVVKTISGSAGIASEALDSLQWPELLGTLAGENTVLAVASSEETAPVLADKIRSMM